MQLENALPFVFFNLWFPKRGSESENPMKDHLEKIVATLNQKLRLNPTNKKIKESVLHWLNYSLVNGFAHSTVQYIADLLPSLFDMRYDKEDEVSKQAISVCALLSQVPIPTNLIQPYINNAAVAIKANSWHSRSAVLPFLQILVFNIAFVATNSELKQIEDIILNSLLDERVEVRELARVSLTSILKSTNLDIQQLIQTYSKYAETKLPQQKTSQNPSSPVSNVEDPKIKRHAGILALTAIVESSPYDIQKWMPDILVTIAKHSSDPVPIKDTVKNSFAEFWRTHQDSWQLQKNLFTSDQLDIINELERTPTYFA